MTRTLKLTFAVLLALLIAGGLVALYVYFLAGGGAAQKFGALFPNEAGEGIENAPAAPAAQERAEIAPAPEKTLYQLSREPVAGAIVVGVATSTALFAERETGNMYSAELQSGARTRLTNATLPRLQEAIFSSDGSRTALRYLSGDGATIETFLANVPREPNLDKEGLAGSFLPQNISFITPEPGGKEFFYLLPQGSGALGLITREGNDRQALSLSLSEWLPAWPAPKSLLLQSRASGRAPGYAYLFDAVSGVRTRVLGERAGLTLLMRPDLKVALYSESGGGWLTLFTYDLASGTSRPVAVKTLPEKCVWENIKKLSLICAVPNTIEPGVYPDIWYQGLVSFSDSLWRVDTETDELTLLADLPDLTKSDVDAVNLQLSADDSFLVFMNKRDGSLWRLELPQESPSTSAD